MSTVWAIVAAIVSGCVAMLFAYLNGRKAERLNTAKQIKKEMERRYEIDKHISGLSSDNVRKRLRNIRFK